DLAAERQEAERQKHADRLWRPKLERIRDGLDSREHARRARTEEAIAEVTDPHAVPMIWAVLIRGDERARLAAVRMLGQIDGPAASNALAALAIFNPSPEVRARSLELLSRRDPRDVIGRLIGMIRKPFKYEVRRVNGPGSVGRLFVEGERYNVQRFYDDPAVDPAFLPPRLFAPSVPFDPFSVQNMILVSSVMNGMAISPGPSAASVQQTARALAANPHNAAAILKNAQAAPAGAPTVGSDLAYQLQAEAAYRDMEIGAVYREAAQNTAIQQQRLARDIQAVETTNGTINELNRRVLPVLGMITGQDLGAEPDMWKAWWTDQLGYAYESNVPETKPTFTDAVDAPFTVGTSHTACFAAGTPVVTLTGPRAIESIQVGDQVLAQDPVSGQFRFQPVLAVHRNRPTATLRIVIGDEKVVATGIHRFWRAGKGWAMARDLKAGDRLRVVGGTVPVRSVEPGPKQAVYNLDVAEHRDFFVGEGRLLVHDFSFVQPVLNPFDREPEQPASPSPSPSRPASMLGHAGK
ncbi:MAG: polymorphic toxin-type HINT domain-containing protein, partial [Isosphaeraceae bacterium]